MRPEPCLFYLRSDMWSLLPTTINPPAAPLYTLATRHTIVGNADTVLFQSMVPQSPVSSPLRP